MSWTRGTNGRANKENERYGGVENEREMGKWRMRERWGSGE